MLAIQTQHILILKTHSECKMDLFGVSQNGKVKNTVGLSLQGEYFVATFKVNKSCFYMYKVASSIFYWMG